MTKPTLLAEVRGVAVGSLSLFDNHVAYERSLFVQVTSQLSCFAVREDPPKQTFMKK